MTGWLVLWPATTHSLCCNSCPLFLFCSEVRGTFSVGFSAPSKANVSDSGLGRFWTALLDCQEQGGLVNWVEDVADARRELRESFGEMQKKERAGSQNALWDCPASLAGSGARSVAERGCLGSSLDQGEKLPWGHVREGEFIAHLPFTPLKTSCLFIRGGKSAGIYSRVMQRMLLYLPLKFTSTIATEAVEGKSRVCWPVLGDCPIFGMSQGRRNGQQLCRERGTGPGRSGNHAWQSAAAEQQR